jgi:hypothetical protein
MADWRYHRVRRTLLTALQPIGGTEPDLDLIKQVEQVTTLVLEGTGPALCQDWKHRNHIGVVILVFLIWQIWLG